MNRRGVTLIEMLIALVISAIAMMALAVPLIAERAMVGSGKAQTESQRDAEMVMRAIARAARQSTSYAVFNPGPNAGTVQFQDPVTRCFQANTATGKLLMSNPGGTGTIFCGAGGPAPAVELIDGVRSKVTNTTIPTTGFTITSVNNKLVRIRLEVTHTPIVGSGRQEKEVVETEIFLRNVP